MSLEVIDIGPVAVNFLANIVSGPMNEILAVSFLGDELACDIVDIAAAHFSSCGKSIP